MFRGITLFALAAAAALAADGSAPPVSKLFDQDLTNVEKEVVDLAEAMPADQYGFFCVDYLKTATWNTSHPGTQYGVGDPVPNHTAAQLVEAAYLSSKLYVLGGSSANLNRYQGS